MLVPRSRLDEAEQIAAAVAEKITPGDPMEQGSRIGPLVSDEHFRKVSSFLGSGEKVLHGGEIAGDRYVLPTII